MRLTREQVVDFIRTRGDEAHADAAQTELPETIELPRDEGLLAQYGVKADDVGDSGDWGG